MTELRARQLLAILTEREVEFRFDGNPDLSVSGVCNVCTPKPNCLCFWAREQLPPDLMLDASNLLIANIGSRENHLFHRNTIFVEDPYLAFIFLAEAFKPARKAFIHEKAIIAPDVVVGGDVGIGANSVIGPNVTIGNNVMICECCVIRHCRIGNNVQIFPSVVIGCAGSGHRKDKHGHWHAFPHFGEVLIRDDVTIGDLTSIIRGTLNDTLIGRGTQIGGKCRIGHGVSIGENSIILPCVTIGGSTAVGADVWLGINVCIRDDVTIGDNTVVGMGAVVVGNIPAGEVWLGNPARFARKSN